jgi:hypothetical protein
MFLPCALVHLNKFEFVIKARLIGGEEMCFSVKVKEDFPRRTAKANMSQDQFERANEWEIFELIFC